MLIQTHQPAFPLNKFIKNLIYCDVPEIHHNLDRFLPDGNTELIIDLSDKPQHIYHNETLQEIQVCKHTWVSGVRTQPITIPSGKGSRLMIVAFHRGRAFPFYPFAMSELSDNVVEADLVFGKSIHDLRERMLAAPSIDRMFAMVEAFLRQQAGKALEEDLAARCIQYALTSLTRKPTSQRLHHLSEEIGYSQKHFIQLFRQQVGVLPKQYLRILRFQKALQAIENSSSIDWSSLALENGFYDQAHLIHDFKLFSGFTPGEYLKRKTPLLNYIPVG